MTLVSTETGRGGRDRNYIHRPVLGINVLHPVQQAIKKQLNYPFLFRPVPGNGSVSLIERKRIQRAQNTSRYIAQLLPGALANQLLVGLPESRNQGRNVPVAGIDTMGSGDWSHIVLILNDPVLEQERQSVLERLNSLGHLSIWPHDRPSHVTLGVVGVRLPRTILKEAASFVPAALDLGSVLPRPMPMDHRLGRGMAAAA